MIPTQWRSRLFGVGAMVLLSGFAVAAARQGAADQSGSVAALSNEVRLLRQSVEKSGQVQSQVQAMAVYLSATQNRLNQAAGRADAERSQLAAILGRAGELSAGMKAFQERLTSAPGGTDERSHIEGMISEAKAELARLSQQESEVQIRVAEADRAIQIELARWTDMISRLEQVTRQ